MNRKLSFTITDTPSPLHTRTIMDLCDYLTDKMLAPRFTASGAHWDQAAMDFFTFDNTCDPLQPTGTIIFTVPPLFAGCVQSLQAAIVEELGKLKIRTARIVREKSPEHPSIVVMRIPVVDNPTALLQPPEVNMSKTRGFVVLRDLLGYQPVGGRYEFEARELLERLGRITEAQIATCTASPVRDTGGAAGLQRRPSLISVKAVHRCLEEIREFAEWAAKHRFRRLAAT
jgi:hypothetical protein